MLQLNIRSSERVMEAETIQKNRAGSSRVMEANTMKIRKTVFVAILIAMSALVAETASGQDVYVLGAGGVLWKNGVQQKYVTGSTVKTANSFARGLFVSGNDVYLAGRVVEKFTSSPVATVWKNGVEQKINETVWSEANSIFVSGEDVYVAGWEDNGGKTALTRKCFPMLWKNGVGQKLAEPKFGAGDDVNEISNVAKCVFVSGNDVYVTGLGDGDNMLWKNGEPQKFLTKVQLLSTSFNSVYVSGNDVYVAGCASSTAALWKNGEPQELGKAVMPGKKPKPLKTTVAMSVFVAGNDVYVAGQGQGVPVLWKNGVAQILSTEGFKKGEFVTKCVFVSGNDVYVAGYEKSKMFHVAILWKNGELQKLEGKGLEAYSVFVVDNK